MGCTVCLISSKYVEPQELSNSGLDDYFQKTRQYYPSVIHNDSGTITRIENNNCRSLLISLDNSEFNKPRVKILGLNSEEREDFAGSCALKQSTIYISSTKAFEDILLAYVNKVRNNPQSLIPYLEGMILKSIKDNRYKNYVIVNHFKVYLREGQESIRKAVQFLKVQSSMIPLSRTEELKVKFPCDTKDWDSPLHISKAIQAKRKKLRARIGFHIDFTCLSPFQSLVFQIIDDNGLDGQRRKNIFNEQFSFCSLSAMKMAMPQNSTRKNRSMGNVDYSESYALYCVFA